MPTIEEQLTEVYVVVDELHDIETRLRKAVDTVRENLDTHRPQGEPTDDHQ